MCLFHESDTEFAARLPGGGDVKWAFPAVVYLAFVGVGQPISQQPLSLCDGGAADNARLQHAVMSLAQ